MSTYRVLSVDQKPRIKQRIKARRRVRRVLLAIVVIMAASVTVKTAFAGGDNAVVKDPLRFSYNNNVISPEMSMYLDRYGEELSLEDWDWE